MKKPKRKSPKKYMTIFVNGKQKRVKREPTIDDLSIDEFIRQNADPIWLHQNEEWEYLDEINNSDGGLYNSFNSTYTQTDNTAPEDN